MTSPWPTCAHGDDPTVCSACWRDDPGPGPAPLVRHATDQKLDLLAALAASRADLDQKLNEWMDAEGEFRDEIRRLTAERDSLAARNRELRVRLDRFHRAEHLARLQVDRLQAEIDRMRPVVDAAIALCAEGGTATALFAAAHTYQQGANDG